MPSCMDAIRKQYGAVIAKTDTLEVGEDLRRIAGEAGLGVAILVAWQHGLTIGHIPLEPAAGGASSPHQIQRSARAGGRPPRSRVSRCSARRWRCGEAPR